MASSGTGHEATGARVPRHGPVPGAIESFVGWPRTTGSTSSPPDRLGDRHTLEWLSEHGVIAREIHFLADKAAVSCDIYLDDAPHQLEALRSAHPAPPCADRWPPITGPCPGHDVHSWEEFREVVAEVAAAGAPERLNGTRDVTGERPDAMGGRSASSDGQRHRHRYTVEGNGPPLVLLHGAARRRSRIGTATALVPAVVHAVLSGRPGAWRNALGRHGRWSRDTLVDDLLAYAMGSA